MAIGDERWYFTREELDNSPSRRFGIDAEKELSYRQQAANLIQDIGQKLKVTQLVINTAIVYMHRFYTFHSFSRFHRNAISSCAVFLAAKVEEQPRKLEHVIKVSHLCIHRDNVDTKSEQYQQLVADLVYHENLMLRTLGFNLNVQHPHTTVVNCCQLVKANKDLAQTSYFMATNSLHLTTMCLQYKPTVVACICIYFVCKWGDFELGKSSEDKDWWTYVDPNVTRDMLEELTNELIMIFQKCPSRLKKILSSSSRMSNSPSMKQLEAGRSQHQTQAPPPPAAPSSSAIHPPQHLNSQDHGRSTTTTTSASLSSSSQAHPTPPPYASHHHHHASKAPSRNLDTRSQPAPMPKVQQQQQDNNVKLANSQPALNRNGTLASKALGSHQPSVIPANVFSNNSNSGGAYNEQMFEMQMFSSDSNDNSDCGQITQAGINKAASNLFDEFKMEFSDNEDEGDIRSLTLSSMISDTSNDAKLNIEAPSSLSNFEYKPSNAPPPATTNAFSQLSADLKAHQLKTSSVPPASTTITHNSSFQSQQARLNRPALVGNNVMTNPLLNQQLGSLPADLVHNSSIAMAAMATATASVPSSGFVDASKSMNKLPQPVPELVADKEESPNQSSSRHKEKKKHKHKKEHKHKHKHKDKDKDRDRSAALLAASSPGPGQLKLKISKHKLSVDEPPSDRVTPIQPLKLKISLAHNTSTPTSAHTPELLDSQSSHTSKKRKACEVALPQFAATISATKVAKKT